MIGSLDHWVIEKQDRIQRESGSISDEGMTGSPDDRIVSELFNTIEEKFVENRDLTLVTFC